MGNRPAIRGIFPEACLLVSASSPGGGVRPGEVFTPASRQGSPLGWGLEVAVGGEVAPSLTWAIHPADFLPKDPPEPHYL